MDASRRPPLPLNGSRPPRHLPFPHPWPPARRPASLRGAEIVASVTVAGTAALLIAAAGCGGEPPSTERVLLERERANLRGYLETPPDQPVVRQGDVLVTVRDELFQTVLDATLPQTETVAGRYEITLRSADVRIRSGLALVELAGRAALAGDPDVFADVTAFGLLRIVGLDPVRSTLRAEVDVLGFETRDVGLRGLSPPAERLVDALARRRAEEFDELLSDLELPVSLQESLELPVVDEEEVTARGGRLGLQVRIVDVKALEDRLWIALAATLEAPRPPADTAEAAETLPGPADGAASGSAEARR